MNFRPVDQTLNELIKNPAHVRISKTQAAVIWNIFRKQDIANDVYFADIKNRAFMQACLIAAIDGSNAMSLIQTIFDSAYTPNATVKGIIEDLVTHLIKFYFLNEKRKADSLYLSVISSIAYQQKFRFEMIKNGLEI